MSSVFDKLFKVILLIMLAIPQIVLLNVFRAVKETTKTVKNNTNTTTPVVVAVIVISYIILTIINVAVNIEPTPEAQTSKELDKFSNQLYNQIIVADYRSALARSIELEKDHEGVVIENVVNRLLDEANRNTLEFAYTLWCYGSEEIVIKYFPLQFRLILDNKVIKIINKKDGLALKLAAAEDDDGDRPSYGDGYDKTSNVIGWKMFSVWENNRLYFKILNVHRNQYLKLELARDSEGDHKAFGATRDDTYRHQWYLQPLLHKKDTLFYIFNREYDQALKLGRTVDRNEDRVLWSHNGLTVESPELYGWEILPL